MKLKMKTTATLLTIIFLVSMLSIIPVSAKVVQVDMYTWPSHLTKVGKVIFGNPKSASDASAVDWMVTVILQNAAPDHDYLVYLERDYSGGGFYSLGVISTDSFGCGSFHFNGDFNDPILGIYEAETYVLGICLNDVTGNVPIDPVGITWNVGSSVITTYEGLIPLRTDVPLR